jgi:hypothetical protein
MSEMDMNDRLKARWDDNSSWNQEFSEGRWCFDIILEGYVVLVVKSQHGWFWRLEPGGEPLHGRDDGYFSTFAEARAKAKAFEALSKAIRDESAGGTAQ